MNNGAIRIENLSKQYSIGRLQKRQDTLRDVLMEGVRASAKWFSARHQAQSRADQNVIWALKDVSFQIERGEVVGVIGRNGAGKSTLLKILSRITEPTKGRAIISGRVGSLLEVGTGFHPELTGRENIYLNAAVLGMKRVEINRKFDEIVEFAEIAKFLDTPVKRYSSGMYVRLAFAVAAHLEPEILLVDEVLAVGDAAFQTKCLGKMRDIGNSGRTVLFVSHSMSAVQRLCSRGILLESGTVKCDAPVRTAVEKYLSSNVGSTYQSVSGIVDKPTIEKASWELTGVDEITLDVSFKSPHRLCPPVLGFVVYDALGIPVFGTNPRLDPHASLPDSMQEGNVRVQISVEALRPGTYYVSLWLGDQYQDYCQVDHAIRFELKPGMLNSPVAQPHIIGSTFLKTRWQYDPQAR